MYRKPNKLGGDFLEEEFDYELLNKKIEKMGFNQIKFADSIPMSRTSLYMKLNNKTAFTQTDMRKICSILNIPSSQVGKYFFTPVVRKSVQIDDKEVSRCNST